MITFNNRWTSYDVLPLRWSETNDVTGDGNIRCVSEHSHFLRLLRQTNHKCDKRNELPPKCHHVSKLPPSLRTLLLQRYLDQKGKKNIHPRLILKKNNLEIFAQHILFCRFFWNSSSYLQCILVEPTFWSPFLHPFSGSTLPLRAAEILHMHNIKV